MCGEEGFSSGVLGLTALPPCGPSPSGMMASSGALCERGPRNVVPPALRFPVCKLVGRCDLSRGVTADPRVLSLPPSPQYIMELTFTQAAKGVNKEMVVNINDACPRCDGRGHEPGTKVQHCNYCNGTGMVSPPCRPVREPPLCSELLPGGEPLLLACLPACLWGERGPLGSAEAEEILPG